MGGFERGGEEERGVVVFFEAEAVEGGLDAFDELLSREEGTGAAVFDGGECFSEEGVGGFVVALGGRDLGESERGECARAGLGERLDDIGEAVCGAFDVACCLEDSGEEDLGFGGGGRVGGEVLERVFEVRSCGEGVAGVDIGVSEEGEEACGGGRVAAFEGVDACEKAIDGGDVLAFSEEEAGSPFGCPEAVAFVGVFAGGDGVDEVLGLSGGELGLGGVEVVLDEFAEEGDAWSGGLDAAGFVDGAECVGNGGERPGEAFGLVVGECCGVFVACGEVEGGDAFVIGGEVDALALLGEVEGVGREDVEACAMGLGGFVGQDSLADGLVEEFERFVELRCVEACFDRVERAVEVWSFGGAGLERDGADDGGGGEDEDRDGELVVPVVWGRMEREFCGAEGWDGLSGGRWGSFENCAELGGEAGLRCPFIGSVGWFGLGVRGVCGFLWRVGRRRRSGGVGGGLRWRLGGLGGGFVHGRLVAVFRARCGVGGGAIRSYRRDVRAAGARLPA